MQTRNNVMPIKDPSEIGTLEPLEGEELLRSLVVDQATNHTTAAPGLPVVGEVVALADNGRTPLLVYRQQPGSAAVPARSVIDLHGAHIGRQVLLVFEDGDTSKPIVVGLLRGVTEWPTQERPAQIDVDADGERLVVTAKHQLVLRCGKASITLTKAGKVLIEGTYVSSRSTGVNRIKGGSVQLN
jgi:hypothetical protein